MWTNLLFPHYSWRLSEVKKQASQVAQSHPEKRILIGDGACQAVQGCLGFVSPRKGCQEPRKTGGMSP